MRFEVAVPSADFRVAISARLMDIDDIEPTGCAFAWLLLLLSMVAHAMHYCGGDECETDDDEPNTMYS
eukprot:COSAG02_NODE_953_length_15689_cov_112.180564_9_plen_68_part_00